MILVHPKVRSFRSGKVVYFELARVFDILILLLGFGVLVVLSVSFIRLRENNNWFFFFSSDPYLLMKELDYLP